MPTEPAQPPRRQTGSPFSPTGGAAACRAAPGAQPPAPAGTRPQRPRRRPPQGAHPFPGQSPVQGQTRPHTRRTAPTASVPARRAPIPDAQRRPERPFARPAGAHGAAFSAYPWGASFPCTVYCHRARNCGGSACGGVPCGTGCASRRRRKSVRSSSTCKGTARIVPSAKVSTR